MGLEVGTGTAFFTFASQGENSYKKVSGLFSLILAAIALFTVLYVFAVHIFGMQDYFWPQVDASYMGYGLFLAFGIYLSTMASRVTDASGQAKKVELIRGCISTASLALILLLVQAGLFSLKSATLIISVSYYVLAILVFKFGHRSLGGGKLDFTQETLSESWKMFFRYCSPLVAFSICGAIFSIIDRWLLQKHGGSIQQGYFGFCQQLSAAIFLITGSMTPIFHRECSAAFFEKRIDAVRVLFTRDLRRFFSITAFLAFLAAINAREILGITAGPHFEAASASAMLLFLYPIHQTYGQLSSTLLLANGRTKLYLWVGLIDGCLGIGLSYLLLADVNVFAWKLNLGAQGLAIKFLILQFVDTSIYNFLNCKLLNTSFRKMITKDFLILWILGILGIVSHYASDLLWTLPNHYLSLLTKSVFFTLMSACVVLLFPEIFGLNREMFKKELKDI